MDFGDILLLAEKLAQHMLISPQLVDMDIINQI